jgi:hypothetical protein
VTLTNRLIRDGKVAVIYSPGFGAGWSTWNIEYTEYGQELIFDPGLADLLINRKSQDQIEAYVALKWNGVYTGGLEQAVVEWVPIGTEFKITEYDGSESLQFRNSDEWITA